MPVAIEKFEELDLVRVLAPVVAESPFRGPSEFPYGAEGLIVRDLSRYGQDDCYEIEFDDPKSGLPMYHAEVHAELLAKIEI